MKQALIKVQALLDYFQLHNTISGKQQNGQKEINVFAQSPFFDIGIHINSQYVVVRAFDRFEHNQFLHMAVYLEEIDFGIAQIIELLEEHTHNTL